MGQFDIVCKPRSLSCSLSSRRVFSSSSDLKEIFTSRDDLLQLGSYTVLIPHFTFTILALLDPSGDS